MLLYLNKEGRLGHQLSHFIILLSYATKYQKSFFYPSFYKQYAAYFDIQSPYFNKPNSIELAGIRILYAILKWLKIKHLNLGNYSFILCNDKRNELIFDDAIHKLFTSPSKFIITDYMLNDVNCIIEQLEFLRQHIQVATIYKQAIETEINKLRNQFKTIIAIHIRRTDFKTFKDGKYFFNEDTYKKNLQELIKILNLNPKKIAIYLCADEKIDSSVFSDYTIIYEVRTMINDFLLLMHADYIISSKSIFSTCASLLGNNLIVQISNRNFILQASDIQTCSNLLKKDYDLKNEKELPDQ
ncbi:MAG: hypothetical protein KDD21_02415 [Bacteroidetes bacterium]|nr:hypothetical protein [Bacteroidota bacterium]